MTMFTKIFAGAAGVAALATAAPAAAQYYSYAPRYASPYGAPYGNAYGYNANVTNMAAQQCAAAVQSRLNTRVGMTGILGAVLGARTSGGRVLQVTQISPNRRSMTVRGLATSGRAYAYSPYGYGAYGATGYNYRPDLSFRCSVDYRGYIRDVDINRR
jgi:hypothetical protein